MGTKPIFDYQLNKLALTGFVLTNSCISRRRKFFLNGLVLMNTLFFGLSITFATHFFISNISDVIAACETYSFLSIMIFALFKICYTFVKKSKFQDLVKDLREISRTGKDF